MALQVPGPGVVYSTGYLLGDVVFDTSLNWDQETATLSAGAVPWSSLPAEAQTFPLMISIPGQPPAGGKIVISIPQGWTIPAHFAGTTTIQDIACTAAAVFAFSTKRGAAVTAFGTVTLLPAGGTACTLAAASAFVMQPDDALIVNLPANQDATLSGVGISLLLVKS